MSYYNGTSFTFTWEQGRRLTTLVKNNGSPVTYTYNDEGIRTSKTVNGVTHTYHLSGSQIIAEEIGNELFVYMYDADGSPIGMQYRNTSYADGAFDVYWYEKNLQGDIVAIYDNAGNRVGWYFYDAWGNARVYSNSAATSVYARRNPFRYRGYYYDSESGLYYLNSRYYDPKTGRFLNADEAVSTGRGIVGNNMFAYCNNNPVNACDPCGTCIHRWDFWNDCEKCGGETFKDKWNGFWNGIDNGIQNAYNFVNDINNIIRSNISADAGLCIGIGVETTIADVVGVSLMSRADIVGARYKNSKLQTGHNGYSGANLTVAGLTLGPQSHTYESYDRGIREVYEDEYIDYGISVGSSAAFVIGYHWNISISFHGMAKDLLDYFSR